MKNQIIGEIIDKVQNKINEIDNPDLKYINIALYDSSQFNAENLVKMIQRESSESFSKEKLIDNLKLMSHNIKSQIFEQVKDHYPTFISLSNKLQNIDYMIDNIEKPIESMKIKLSQEIDFTKNLKEELILSKNALTKINSEIILLELSIRIDSLFVDIKKEIDTYDCLNSERILKFSNEGILLNYNNLKQLLNNLLFTADKINEFNIIFKKSKSLYEIDSKLKLNEKVDVEINNDLAQYYNNIYKQYLRINEEEQKIVSFLQNTLNYLLNIYLKTKKRSIILNFKKNTNSYFSNSEMKETKSVTTKTTSKTSSDYKVIKSVSQYEVIISKLIKILSILDGESHIYNAFSKNQILNNMVSETMDLVDNSLKTKIIILSREYYSLFGDLLNNFKIRKMTEINITTNCFLRLVCQKIATDKSLFNCTDINSFNENYSSIILLIHSVKEGNLNELNQLYVTNKNNISCVMNQYIKNYLANNQDIQKEKNIDAVNEFSYCIKILITSIQKYSFFTYFQLIQSEINKVLLEYYSEQNYSINSSNKKTYITQNNSSILILKDLSFKSNFASKIMNITNFLYSLNKSVQDQYNGNRIFTKILPNWFNYTSTLNNYIMNIISIFLTSSEVISFCAAIKEYFKNNRKDENEAIAFSFNEFEMSSMKDLMIMFLHNISEYYYIMTFSSKKTINYMVSLEKPLFFFIVRLFQYYRKI